MTEKRYHKMQANHCVFVKKFDGGDFLILLLYVDDMLIVRRDHMKIRALKKALNRSFSMKDINGSEIYLAYACVYAYDYTQGIQSYKIR